MWNNLVYRFLTSAVIIWSAYDKMASFVNIGTIIARWLVKIILIKTLYRYCLDDDKIRMTQSNYWHLDLEIFQTPQELCRWRKVFCFYFDTTEVFNTIFFFFFCGSVSERLQLCTQCLICLIQLFCPVYSGRDSPLLLSFLHQPGSLLSVSDDCKIVLDNVFYKLYYLFISGFLSGHHI